MAEVLTVYFSMKGQTIGPGMKIVELEKGNMAMANVDGGASFTGSRVSSSEAKIAEWAKSKL